MSKRGTICDYAGDEIRKDDVVTYAARRGNTVRMADAVVIKTYTRKLGGRIYPMLRLAPTGQESGWVARGSMRVVHVAAVHVRRVATGEELGFL
ncbi:hypothetical protein LHJ74_30835 [Streptomyces sp. N2-109]|uniref:Uncharacterized protein n=1 Tax=Streptomyces gossypii TaxID=2883101 RepID=A0ABT2K259_9ACTN|nr:hypothetical protein [Streptomyces gossypii]MCT2594253.1 hypothetical protein [Streptomyces gossypii]